MKFVGIDLAWSERNPSGVAVIDAEGTLCRAEAGLRTNQAICEYGGLADEDDGAVIAIDAPLIVTNADKQRPVERDLTDIFSRYEATPFPANLSNPIFKESGRIRQFAIFLQSMGFKQRSNVEKQKPQRVFLEVFPSPSQVVLFPGVTHHGHGHYRPPRYKHKAGRSWTETQCEWETYRARLLSLRAKEPSLTFSSEIKSVLAVDVEEYRGSKYKKLDDLLDGIFCAYLAFYFWYWGEERSWVIGDMDKGCVTLPFCELHNCELRAHRSSSHAVRLAPDPNPRI